MPQKGGYLDLLPHGCGHFAAQFHASGVQLGCVNGFRLFLQCTEFFNFRIHAVCGFCRNGLKPCFAGSHSVKLLPDLLHAVRVCFVKPRKQQGQLGSQFLHVLGDNSQLPFDFPTAQKARCAERFQFGGQRLFLPGFLPQQLPYRQEPLIVRSDQLNVLFQIFSRAGMIELRIPQQQNTLAGCFQSLGKGGDGCHERVFQLCDLVADRTDELVLLSYLPVDLAAVRNNSLALQRLCCNTLVDGGDFIQPPCGVAAMVTATSGDPQYFFTSCCAPGMSYNFGTYENADVNAMIDELATEFDTEKRGELAVKLQQTILDDNAYVFCSFLQMNMISKSTGTGYTAHACDYYQVTADLDINA